MPTVQCQCCKRVIRADIKLCWECRGRPPLKGGHPVPPAGKRDPGCPHEVPQVVR